MKNNSEVISREEFIQRCIVAKMHTNENFKNELRTADRETREAILDREVEFFGKQYDERLA